MSVRVIILAGQRPGPDPLSEANGVVYKADIPLCGTAMLDRVADALDASGQRRPYVITGYPTEKEGFIQAKAGEGPADSAIIAAESGAFPVLLTTCDNALLTPEIIQSFLSDAQASGADMAVGFASERVIAPAYPNTKRTYLRFSDEAVSGCNLFYLANERALNALRFWRSAQHLRKKPVRLAWTVGPMITLRYALGKLSLAAAFDYASRRMGTHAVPVLIDIPEAAIDVDTIADKALVEAIISARES